MMFASGNDYDVVPTQNSESGHRSFKLAYILVILIAVLSVGLSFAFMGTGEADEGDLLLPPVEDTQVSPFLISNTSGPVE